MKIALDWIGEYLAPLPTAAEAGDALMNAGLPVESIEDAAGVKGPTKVLDVEVTSNRTDCFSHVGLARELAALTGGRFSMPKVALAESAGAAAVSAEIAVAVEDAAGCPYYSARVIRNVKVGPSPEWLVKRLESIGLRPINNVVDVTNYVLMELGQPLHAFDLDKVGGKQIIVRAARAREKMVAIDGKEYALDPSMLLIADVSSPLAIAGVMGGKSSEVTDGTTSILLESARFDPLSIRTTSRALGLKSDSSYRFERGLDPSLAEMASKRAIQLMLEVAGTPQTQVVPGMVAVGAAAAKPLTVSMRFSRFEKITGISLSPDRAMAILSALGFSPWVDDEEGKADDRICTRIPSHRLDVTREIDLIEEVMRVLGYGQIPMLDRVTHPVMPEPSQEKAARTVLATMTEAGFSEAVTVTFIGEAEARPFLAEEGGGQSLIHPQHAGWRADVLRPSLLPSLLAVRRTNQNAGMMDARVFEKAETFVQPADVAAAPLRQRMVAAVAGDLSALAALLTLLPDRLNGTAAVSMAAVPRDFGVFVKGASAEVRMSVTAGAAGEGKTPVVIGRMGIFTPEIQRRYDLRNQVAGMELNYDSLLAIFTATRRAVPVPRFPGIRRDLSVVVEEAVRWADVKGKLLEMKLAGLESIDFVTTFRSKEIGAGKKSLTLSLEFREGGRTLKNEEVDPQVQAAVGGLKEGFGAALRA